MGGGGEHWRDECSVNRGGIRGDGDLLLTYYSGPHYFHLLHKIIEEKNIIWFIAAFWKI